MSFTQGAPLPDIKQTTTTATTTPDYYTDYLTKLSNAGQTAIGKTAAEGVAGYDPLQDTGYGQVQTAAGAYQPGLTAAGKTAQTAASGLTSANIQQFLNPYTTNVVDEMARLQQKNLQQNILPGLKAGFVGSGALGSQRYAGALGQSLADMQANLTGQQQGALSSGYTQAMDAALKNLNLQNTAAQTQAQIAGKEQELGLTGAGALTKAGAERQAYQQSLLDYPLKTATNVSGLLRGFQVPQNQTQTFVGPKPGAYQNSGLANLTGILSLLGSGAAGTAGTRASELLGAVRTFLSGLGRGGSMTPEEVQNEIDRLLNRYPAPDTGTGGDTGTGEDTGTED